MKTIKEFVEKYEEGKENYLIIGNNGSGKTYILEELIKKSLISNNNNNNNLEEILEKIEDYNQINSYYINVYNREYKYSEKAEKEKILYKSTLKNRLVVERSDDMVIIEGKRRRNSESWVNYLFQKKYLENVEKFFSKDQKIIFKNKEVNILGQSHPLISEGYQGIIRLICEVSFACDIEEIKTIYIDEIEKYIDYINCYWLVKYLKKLADKKNKKLVITTHSPKVILGAEDFKVVKLKIDSNVLEERSIEIINSNVLDRQIYIEEKLFWMDDILKTPLKYSLIDLYFKINNEEKLSVDEMAYLKMLDDNCLSEEEKSLKKIVVGKL